MKIIVSKIGEVFGKIENGEDLKNLQKLVESSKIKQSNGKKTKTKRWTEEEIAELHKGMSEGVKPTKLANLIPTKSKSQIRNMAYFIRKGKEAKYIKNILYRITP